MPHSTILPDPDRLRLTCLHAELGRITLSARTAAERAYCPLCWKPSDRVHSRYVRTIADLPWQGIPVGLRLHVRRFFCDNPSCDRRIFTERLPTVVAPYARRTDRLDAWLTHVAFALGGEPGARLLQQLGITTSGDVLLGCIRSFELKDRPTPRVLSVDDFALRRGRTYGSILVDLDRHSLVDILPDRSGESFARWLAQHPGIEVIARDRGGEYADGAGRGAPDAVQVADRFHLVRNLADVTLRVLRRRSTLVQSLPVPGVSQQTLTRLRLDREGSRERSRLETLERFEAIHTLAAKGVSKSAIATALGIHRHTVQKYLALDTAPERRHYTRKVSILAPYEGYILRRWEGGCHNAMQLWREIVEMGYQGSYRNVSRLTGYLRRQERLGHPSPHSPPGLTVRQAVAVVLSRDRTEEEQATVELLKALHPDIHTSVVLLEEFVRMVRDSPDEHAGQRLDQWMSDAESSGLPELKAFVVKLRQDLEAVLAALSLPYSQGQTEGQINKLKLIKRSMYGRAKLDLLRQRILYTAA